MSDNPLLKKAVIPGKRFRLPSRGLFYTNGELDDSVHDGEVEVFSMATVDEITLRTPEFLFTGEAIEKVFNRCIPEIKQPLKLLSQDVDYLLTCLRIVSYGDILPINTRCSVCETNQKAQNERDIESFLAEVKIKAEEQKIDFDIAVQTEQVQERLHSLQTKNIPKQTHNIDIGGVLTNKTREIEDDDFKLYDFNLTNGQHVHMTPLRLDSAVLAYKFQNDDFTENLDKVEEYITFLLASRVLKVVDDGKEVIDPEHITEWVRVLAVKYKNELNDHASKIPIWGTNFDYNISCDKCGDVKNVDTLLNPINIFMTPSELEE